MNDDRAFFALLDELGIPSHTVQHEAVMTAEGLAAPDIAQWEFPVKNIVVEDKVKQLYLVTMHLLTPPLDLKELAKRIGAAGRFSFASPETLGAALKVLPGSVTPFAAFNDRERRVKVVLDGGFGKRKPSARTRWSTPRQPPSRPPICSSCSPIPATARSGAPFP